MNRLPDFRSPAFLEDHVRRTMAFYHPRAIDPTGGCFHYFKDDGTVYDRTTRHLVSSTRFVFNYATAYRRFREPAHLEATRHALAFLEAGHRDPASGGYAWVVDWRDGEARVLDGTQHAYGLAFVLLAHAHALRAGLDDARAGLDAAWDRLNALYWEPANELLADERSRDGTLSAYRGQNANMHACEALLAAYDATGETRFLDRASLLANSVTQRLAAQADGRIWEHWRLDADGRWQPDWDYNRDDRTNIFRPWGYQPGHFTEWAKLLLTLDARRPAPGRLERARALFDDAMRHAWDDVHGGLHYGFAPDGSVCDGDKYFWVQAESLAAAARLALRTGDDAYWTWYDRLWTYAWQHFVDHEHGAWYRILGPDNAKLTDEKSPAGKTDYHTMGACHDVLEALGA